MTLLLTNRRSPWRIALSFSVLLTACLDPDQPGNLVPNTVDEDTSLPSIELNGTKLHVETFGDPAAPVIVVLHSGPGHDYRGLLRLRRAVDGVRLEDNHFVVFWDQRGCGLSRRHAASEVTLAAYDADLEALLDKFSPERPVVLLAKSWGGMYASHFIGKHPERVAGAVLMESGPLSGALYEDVQDGIRELDLGSEWLNDLAWGQTFLSADDHARADYTLLQGQYADAQPGYHSSTKDREPLWRLGAVAFTEIQRSGLRDGKPSWDFTTGLERFERPVLFMASARNEVIGAAFQKRQMKAYASAELTVVADAGHDFPWTQPEATLRPIFTYLDKIAF